MTNKLIKGLKAELAYCKAKVKEGHRSAHWSIRIGEINKQLKTGKKK